MKKTVILVLSMCFCFLFFVSCRETTPVSVTPDCETYLVFGLDDASENTDVLMLACVNYQKGFLSLLQIPRDTYYRFGAAQNKINQVFAYARTLGDKKEEAAKKLVTHLSDAFGVPVDGYVGITISTFRQIVDAFGGVSVSLSEEFSFDDGTEEGTIYIPQGESILDGAAAEKFVRFRKAYKRGDLGRLDAQKIFLSSFLKTVKEADALTLLSVASILQNKAVSNLSIADSAKNYLHNRKIIHALNVSYATLPGEAMLSQTGLSYYVLNKTGCKDILQKSVGTSELFDKNGLFYNPDDLQTVHIYFDKNADETEYRDDTLGDVRILSQKK